MTTERIRVAQFNDSFTPIMDGVGLVARNYAYWLNKKYGYCCAVVPKVPGYVDKEDFTVHRFRSLPIPGRDPWRLGIPKLDSSIKNQLSSTQFDLFHAHCPFTSAEFALPLARKMGIPLVTTFHSKYRDDFEKNFQFSPAVRWALNKILNFYDEADFVWVPNKGAMDTLREYGFTGEIDIMINGTDLEAPDSAAMEKYRAAGQARIGCSDEDNVLLFVGQHRWIKNIRIIIDSCKVLKDHGKSFVLVFVGMGQDEQEIRKEIDRLGLSENVRFMGKVVEREEMKCFYGRADIFLFPSLYDTASLVMREAAAFSTPSVLVEGASTADGITDGVDGFITPNETADYAAALEWLIDHPETVKKAGEGAKKTLYLPWEKVVDKVYLAYMDILKNFKPRPRRNGSGQSDDV